MAQKHLPYAIYYFRQYVKVANNGQVREKPAHLGPKKLERIVTRCSSRNNNRCARCRYQKECRNIYDQLV